jgi:hypothetical protein
MDHEHMMELDAMLCLPGSMGTPRTALISVGVRTAQASVTGASADGVGERQAERRSVAVRRAKNGFVCIANLPRIAADEGMFLAGVLATV